MPAGGLKIIAALLYALSLVLPAVTFELFGETTLPVWIMALGLFESIWDSITGESAETELSVWAVGAAPILMLIGLVLRAPLPRLRLVLGLALLISTGIVLPRLWSSEEGALFGFWLWIVSPSLFGFAMLMSLWEYRRGYPFASRWFRSEGLWCGRCGHDVDFPDTHCRFCGHRRPRGSVYA